MQPPVAPPFARSLLSLCLAALCANAWADEEPASPGEPIRLKPSTQLTTSLSRQQQGDIPTFIEADHIHGHMDAEMIAEGRVEMRNLREQLRADWLRYDKQEDRVRAYGNVSVDQYRDHVEGARLDLLMSDRIGQMLQAKYEVFGTGNQPSRGTAETLHFKGEKVYQLENSIYTTCPLDGDKEPDWVMRSKTMDLDYTTSLGTGRQVTVEYLGTPILYTPWMDFALDNKRKSGFLTPSLGAGEVSGMDLAVPWYWNIAPNRDATITPRWLDRRGLQLGVEGRYLERTYQGVVMLEALPDDQLAGRSRDHQTLRHGQSFGPNWSLSVDAERVSDSNYFTDLTTTVQSTSRVHLTRQAEATYKKDLWTVTSRIQRFQTLQDAARSITEPYHRLPQVAFNRQPEYFWAGGPWWTLDGDVSRFSHRQNTRVEGTRSYAYPAISVPFRNQYADLTPKIGLHMTSYNLDAASRTQTDTYGAAVTGGFPDTVRSLPIFSLNSNLYMERDWSFLSRDYIQTLEPRAYYVYIPKRDQSRIPVFDSGVSDISIDQIFTENHYSSIDRINEANQLTLAVTSRFIEQDSSQERLQFTLGRRFYMVPQQVALPSEAVRTSKQSDILMAASGQLTPKLTMNAGLQYSDNPRTLMRFNLGGVYKDGPGRVVNADYRFIKNSLKQVDTSWQWPIASRWYGLGRVNYLIKEGRLAEGLFGVEYNAGCWSLRGVVHQLVTSATETSNAIYIQLELRGLTKLGPNPLDVLKRSITGYVKSDEIELPQ